MSGKEVVIENKMSVDTFLSQKISFFNLFLIILVVMIHSINLGDEALFSGLLPLTMHNFILAFVKNSLARIAVPLFFAFSGFFFFSKYTLFSQYKQILRSKLRTLFIPYVLWNTMWILYAVNFFSVIIRNDFGVNFFQAVWKHYIIAPYTLQFWFLNDLMLLFILAPLFMVIKKNKYVYLLILSIFFIAWVCEYRIASMYEAVFFFMLGGLYNNDFLNRIKPSKFTVVLFFLVICVIGAIKTYIEIISGRALDTVIAHKVVILGEMFSLWFIYDYFFSFLGGLKSVKYLAKRSFFVYCFHAPILVGFVSRRILFDNQAWPVLLFLLPTITFGLCIMVAVILEKTIPRMYTILTGGR